jgi:hypothetical protein
MASENSYIPERPRSALCNNCRRLEKMLADRLWLSISACPIVILPGRWRIFRPIAKQRDLLALPSWRYAELARLWGGHRRYAR